MLFQIEESNEAFTGLQAVEFKDFSSFGKKEKELENLIANNLLETLFENQKLLTIHQERQGQAEADIYAIDENGDLVIFELKRASAGEDAVLQALRYSQIAGQWSYSKLEKIFKEYTQSKTSLAKAHKEAFNLEDEHEHFHFNRSQKLIVIGSAADASLISAVDYWKSKGLNINFIPYRIYSLHGKNYFEFFAHPYDIHSNPGHTKGVIFDTNKSYNEDSMWDMMSHSTVEAYGDTKRFIKYLYTNDIIFYSHKGYGIVAAARVLKDDMRAPDERTLSRKVEFLTPIPHEDKPLKAMPFYKVTELLGKTFFWARTIKVPYLSKGEADLLVDELNKYLS